MKVSDFKNAHKWLIIPFIIAILGFMRGYYLRLSEATWHQHMHGLSATLWYIIVIVQPYLVTRGKLRQHRYYGTLALFVAGAVTFSAITIIPQNLKAAATIEPNPIVSADFFYGVSFTDIITIVGFAFSVLMGITKVKNLEDHAFWMISTVFWALMPAFGRLAMIPNMMLFGSHPYDFIDVLFFSTIFCVLPIVIICLRYKRWHPALIAVAIANLLYLFIRPIGSNKMWRAVADEMFKY